MTPLSFDLTTARAIVGDTESRVIEDKARKDADRQAFEPLEPVFNGGGYWSGVQESMRMVVYREQYTKRLERNRRKSESNANRS